MSPEKFQIRNVLGDGVGFIHLTDMMPTSYGSFDGRYAADMAIVQAARVSFGLGIKSAEEDEKLIKYLLKHDHGSPFEAVTLKFHVKTPIFVMRQWIRYRAGHSFNEISGRYTEFKDEFYIPVEGRIPAKTNKQGSVVPDEAVGELSKYTFHNKVSNLIGNASVKAYETYVELIKIGTAKELARIVLPVNLYTEFYWTVNMRAMMHFLRQRLDSHAQFEIRRYAQEIARIFEQVAPVSYKAFSSAQDS